MRKLCLFSFVFLLGPFLFDSPTYACKHQPTITSAHGDLEQGILVIRGEHFGEHLVVKLGSQKLSLVEGGTTKNEIQAKLWEGCQPGTYRLVVSKKIKGRHWRSYWKSDHMDVTIGAVAQEGQPGPLDPPGGVGDTTPPEFIKVEGPSEQIGFLETHVFIDVEVKDDTEVAFIGIQNMALPAKRKMVSAEPGTPSLSVLEQIATIPGENTIVISAVDIFGNVAKKMALFTRERNCVGCKLRALHMRSADLYDADLTGADLRDADLSEANLSRAELSGASLNVANLSYAHLYGAKMLGGSLKFSDLSGADLRDATLSADMWGANLSGADLRGADLTDANLANADLRGANLTGAKMVGTRELDFAIFGNTLCPDGTNSDENDGDRFTCLNNL